MTLMHARRVSKSLRTLALLFVLVCIGLIETTWARYYDLYRADYPKGAFCAVIAGACASDNDSESAFFQNPASAIPPGAEESFQFDGDYGPLNNLEPGMKTSSEVDQTLYMGGIGLNGKKWGWAASLTGVSVSMKTKGQVVDDSDRTQNVTAKDTNYTILLNVPVAYRLTKTLSVGASLFSLYYYEALQVEGAPKSSTKPIETFPPIGFRFGYLWAPSKNFRMGSWARTAITEYVTQDITVSQFSTQIQITEQLGLHDPWIIANGISIMPWADDRTVLMDLDIIGTTSNGYLRTLDTFANATKNTGFRQKGRQVALEPHLAWRSPFSNHSKFWYFLGTYYENSRWDGLPGRIHGTFGLSYKIKLLRSLIGDIEMIVGGDVAKNYFDLQFSFR